MTNSTGFIVWISILTYAIKYGFTHDTEYLQTMIWYILVVRVSSDIFNGPGNFLMFFRETCVFCGKPIQGSLWDIVTFKCDHSPL